MACLICQSALGLTWIQAAVASVYQDKFLTVNRDYQQVVEKPVSVQGGVLTIKTDSDLSSTLVRKDLVFHDMDASVSTALAEISKAPNVSGSGGLVFWASNNQNLYAFLVTDFGYAGVSRMVDNEIVSHPLEWKQIPAIKQGAKIYNQLRVVTKGNRATCYVNGTQVGEFARQEPDGAGKVGLIASGITSLTTEQAFREFLIKY